jgi:hypothetical protein
MRSGLKKEEVRAVIQREIAEDSGVLISKGNTKLNNVPNFSLLPGVTCPGMTEECAFCYAKKCMTYSTRANVRWSVNTHYARTDLGRVMDDLIAQVYLSKSPHFRIHVGGDFFSQDYFGVWTQVARRFPEKRFLAFTKSFGHINFEDRPDNLLIIWSVTPSTEFLQVPTGPRAYLITDEVMTDYPVEERYRMHKAMRCTGTCEFCGMCWFVDENQCDVKFELHKRGGKKWQTTEKPSILVR